MSIWSTKKEETVEPEHKEDEKSPAELIAESVSAAIKPLVDSNAALNARLEAVETNTRKPEPRTEPTEMVSVVDDENLAFAQRLTPLMLRQLETEARMARNEVKSEYTAKGYGEVWTEFEKDINSVLDNSPVVGTDSKPIRGNPDYIRNVVDMVFGRAAIKAGIKFGGRDRGFFLESAGSGDSPVDGASSKDGLTDAQRRVFQRMGVPLADGAKTAAKLKFIN